VSALELTGQLTGDAVLPALATRWLGREYLWLDACSSTSDVAAERGRGGAKEGLVVVADTQGGGRGRLGRSWHSPAGQNLYLSVLLRPARPPLQIPPLTLLAGAVVAETVASLGLRPRLKWPNDVLLETDSGARKVAGILTEMATDGDRVVQVVLGIGINVNTTAFPADLSSTATSLAQALGRAVDRAAVLVALLARLETAYQQFQAQGPAAAVALWEPHAALGTRYRVKTGGTDEIVGVTLGLDGDGALRLRDDQGRVHRVVSGEVAA
jgi:BirA family biotin operon repressor/biotin-[acetyl-CoA-carboxylase] ligase